MGYIFSISTPSPFGHSPYIPLRKHRGRGGLPLLLSLRVFLTPLLVATLLSSPLYFAVQKHPAMLRDTAGRGLCYKGLSFPAKESPCYTNSLYLFILLNSEKNEPRSAAAVIGLLGSSLRSPSGSAELASLGQSSPFFLRLPCDFTAR